MLDKKAIDDLLTKWLPSVLEANDSSNEDELDSLIEEFISSQMEDSDEEMDENRNDEEDSTEINTVEEDSTDTDMVEDNDSMLLSLDHLTGLSAVKKKLSVYEKVVRFNKIRAERNLPTSPTPLHAMFLGSPGTGKTTVAKIIGKMLHRAGILSKGHVVVRERATLIGKYYNSEAESTMNALTEAQGGILFIDEAYQLHQPDDPRDPGKFVIESLLTALADESMRDWMLILAGYPDEMKRMFELNPGFKSRIPDSNIYIFDDFNESELMEIAENYLSRSHFSLSPDAYNALRQHLAADFAGKSKNFGNARHVINLIQTEILPAMAVRVTDSNETDETALTQIQSVDIPKPSVRADARCKRVGFAI